MAMGRRSNMFDGSYLGGVEYMIWFWAFWIAIGLAIITLWMIYFANREI